ncbi:GNAT family N-acetyltransferase [Vibrio sinaloensis]|nr:GNAT family N-acetyltransferase [Vibrio sinaloensis]
MEKNDYYHWIVQVNSVDVGLISLSDYDEASGTTSWGFYIGHDDYLGVGAFVPLYLYNFIFFKSSNVNKITAEVFYDNTNTIKLHTLHGYKFESDKCRVIRKK